MYGSSVDLNVNDVIRIAHFSMRHGQIEQYVECNQERERREEATGGGDVRPDRWNSKQRCFTGFILMISGAIQTTEPCEVEPCEAEPGDFWVFELKSASPKSPICTRDWEASVCSMKMLLDLRSRWIILHFWWRYCIATVTCCAMEKAFLPALFLDMMHKVFC